MHTIRIPQSPLKIRIAPRFRRKPPDLPLRLDPHAGQDDDALTGSAADPGILQARQGGTATRAYLARYRLEGVDLLGSSITGKVDAGGARIYLRWPPEDD